MTLDWQLLQSAHQLEQPAPSCHQPLTHHTHTTHAAQSLWAFTSPKPLRHRHLYEVIWERRPCHLYFDIEYCRRANPTTRGELLVSLLVKLVRDEYAARWGLHLQPEVGRLRGGDVAVVIKEYVRECVGVGGCGCMCMPSAPWGQVGKTLRRNNIHINPHSSTPPPASGWLSWTAPPPTSSAAT